MANFSSGAGYIGFFGFFLAIFFILPPLLLVWAGFALPLIKKDGNINYPVLASRLNFVLLPICIVFFGLLMWFLSDHGYDREYNTLLPVWISFFPTIGGFIAARASAALLALARPSGFTPAKWLVAIIISAVVLFVVGIFGMFMLG